MRWKWWKHVLAVLVTALTVPAFALAQPDPHRATVISLVSTLAPCALGAASFVSDSPEIGWMLTAAGIVIGPATGYVYGGLPGRGLVGAGVRAGAGALGVWGIASAFDESIEFSGGGILVLVGTVVVAGSVAIDLAVVGRQVRERNRRRPVTIVPWRSRDGAPGLALRAEF